jgi:hypothetical protein
MREICTSGSVRGEGGNPLAYSTLAAQSYGPQGVLRGVVVDVQIPVTCIPQQCRPIGQAVAGSPRHAARPLHIPMDTGTAPWTTRAPRTQRTPPTIAHAYAADAVDPEPVAAESVEAAPPAPRVCVSTTRSSRPLRSSGRASARDGGKTPPASDRFAPTSRTTAASTGPARSSCTPAAIFAYRKSRKQDGVYRTLTEEVLFSLPRSARLARLSPVCTANELEQVFGPVASFYVVGPQGREVSAFRYGVRGLTCRELTAGMA